jgi:hypothetical protein
MATYFVIILCDILCELPEPHGARGDVWAGKLGLQAGTVCQKTIAKHDILLK